MSIAAASRHRPLPLSRGSLGDSRTRPLRSGNRLDCWSVAGIAGSIQPLPDESMLPPSIAFVAVDYDPASCSGKFSGLLVHSMVHLRKDGRSISTSLVSSASPSMFSTVATCFAVNDPSQRPFMGEMVQALKRIYNDAEDASGDSHPQGIIVSDDDR